MPIIDDLISQAKQYGISYVQDKIKSIIDNVLNEAGNRINNGQDPFSILQSNNESTNSVLNFINKYKNNPKVRSFFEQHGQKIEDYEAYFRGQNSNDNSNKFDLSKYDKYLNKK